MFQVGQKIGPYTLIERIGRGGFGDIWLAERRAKFVTIKVAVKLPLAEQADISAVRNEARLWEQASGHPNVMPIIDADEYDGQIVIVSEYAPDGSLDDFLKREGPLSITKSVELTIGVLNGLAFLHSKKIIHRDLKPANILLQGDTPRLADFGVSRVMKSTNTSTSISGTPSYMAPEAFDGIRSVQTDIWSVGAMMYEMLSGARPFSQDNMADLLGAIVRHAADPLPNHFPTKLKHIVFKSLAKNPQARYQSAKEMRIDLEDLLVAISKQDLEKTLPNGQLLKTLAIENIESVRTPDDEGVETVNMGPSLRPKSISLGIMAFVSGLFLIIVVIGGSFLYRASNFSSLKDSDLAPADQVFRYYLRFPPESFDPQQEVGTDSVIAALFDGLTELDVTGMPRPSLAKSWDVSQDATVWTFQLRPEAKWSDGNPITAQDFIYSWKRALAPNSSGFYSNFLLLIKNGAEFTAGKTMELGVRAIDEHILEVTLTEPRADFDRLLAMSVFRPVPKQAIDRWGPKLWIMPEHIITSGAFRISDKKSDQMTLEKNSLFWDDANTQLNQIILKYPRDERTNGDGDPGFQLYEDGEVDADALLTSKQVEQVRKRKDVFSYFTGNAYLRVNLNVKPLDDPRVRRALSFAVSRSQLEDAFPWQKAGTTFVPPFEGYEGVTGISGTVESARSLLSDAGFPQGRGFPKIEFLYIAKNHFQQRVGEMVRENWSKELGIEIQLVPEHDLKIYLKNVENNKFNGIALSLWTPDYHDPYSYLEILSSNSRESQHLWNDVKYDELLLRANKELDLNRRSAILREAESYMLEQMPVIPLAFASHIQLCKPYVKNFTTNTLGRIDFRSIYIKK